jgi:hypothetical protein
VTTVSRYLCGALAVGAVVVLSAVVANRVAEEALERIASPSTESFAARVAKLPIDDSKPADGDLWALRVSYPTGRFQSRWVVDAARHHRAMAARSPAGRKRYQKGLSPLELDPDAFTALGPAPLQSDGCQSCFSFGKSAGRVNVLVSDPGRTNIAYLGSDGGGVWKTTNCCTAATVWEPVTDDPLLNGVAIGDLTLDPNDPDTIYAGTGDLRYGSWSFGSSGLLVSNDQGATWSLLGAEVFDPVYPQAAGGFPQYQAIGKVRVDPANSDNLVVGTKTGLFFSHDRGANWDGPCVPSPHATQRHDITGLILRDLKAGTEVIAAVGTRGHNTPVQPDLDQNGANGIYAAALPASGCPASWTLLSRPDNGWPAGTGAGTGYPANTLGRIDLGIAPSDPDVIYAQVASIPTRGQLGVWRTTDGGATWTRRSTATGLTGCTGDGSQNWYDQGVTVSPTDPDTLFISTVDLFRSTDGGTTFVNLTCGYAGAADDVHVDHHARAVVGGDPEQLLVGSDGGAYYTGNALATPATAVTFTQLNDSLSTLETYAGDVTANFATSLAPGINAGMQDNGSATHVWSGAPGPAEWQERLGGDGMYARIEPVLGQRWYQESQNGNLRVSQSGPAGFYSDATGGWTNDRRSFIMPYELAKYDCPETGCEQMIAGSYRVWETIQGAVPASSWYVNSPDLTKGVLGSRSHINQLSFGVSDSSLAIVGANDGEVWVGFGLGQGIANSATWVNVTGANAVLPNRPILDVATDPLDPLVGYAAVGGFDQNTPATPGHLFRLECTADCASFTWSDKSGNLPNIPINSVLANPLNPRQVFAGSDWGLYFTDDITVPSPTWSRFTAGLPTVMVWDMSIDAGFTTLVLFTRSRGAFAWPLSGSAAEIFADGFETGDTSAWATVVP